MSIEKHIHTTNQLPEKSRITKIKSYKVKSFSEIHNEEHPKVKNALSIIVRNSVTFKIPKETDENKIVEIMYFFDGIMYDSDIGTIKLSHPEYSIKDVDNFRKHVDSTREHYVKKKIRNPCLHKSYPVDKELKDHEKSIVISKLSNLRRVVIIGCRKYQLLGHIVKYYHGMKINTLVTDSEFTKFQGDITHMLNNFYMFHTVFLIRATQREHWYYKDEIKKCNEHNWCTKEKCLKSGTTCCAKNHTHENYKNPEYDMCGELTIFVNKYRMNHPIKKNNNRYDKYDKKRFNSNRKGIKFVPK
jgi:hypothetical protein